jgi:hypothetical protein
MKLIYCPECGDIFNLKLNERKTCSCGKSFGEYTDILHAQISKTAIPLGFANFSFNDALKHQPKKAGLGTNFIAFVIPTECDTIKILEE